MFDIRRKIVTAVELPGLVVVAQVEVGPGALGQDLQVVFDLILDLQKHPKYH